MTGLAILAAGKDYGRRINFQDFAHQKTLLDTGLMTIGKWLSSHPPLCDRVAAIQPSTIAAVAPSSRGLVRALAIMGGLLVIPAVVSVVFVALLIPRFQEAFENAQSLQDTSSPAVAAVDIDAALLQIETDMERLASVVDEYHEETGAVPPDAEELYGAWESLRSGEEAPIDPFDAAQYGYYSTDGGFVIWSSGPDGEPETDDDIETSFRLAESPSAVDVQPLD